ncbi:MAG: type IIL restriction-modification enzyme MmeI [Dokdonella sp.]
MDATSDKPREVLVIDLFGLNAEEVCAQFPAVYQHVLEHVKPERDVNNRATYRDNWWIFGEPRGAFRPALVGLSRYIATVETAKHRTFQFLDASIAPDNMLVCVALKDAYSLGVLSSGVHVTWALAAGGRLGVGNDPRYNKSRCFEPFPFPALGSSVEPAPKPSPSREGLSGDGVVGNSQQAHPHPGLPLEGEGEQQHALATRIRSLAEQLDAHRKRQQAAHPDLTLTGMYNVLEKLRSGEVLTPKERAIHEHGLVSVLRQLHDEIDAAVLDAYGWSDLLPLLRIAMGMDARVPRAQDAHERSMGMDAPSPQAQERSHGEDLIVVRAASAAMPLSKPQSKSIAAEAALTKTQMSRDEARRAFDEAILERLVVLNAERAAEEARGLVRWLRPEFQHPTAQTAPTQGEMDTGADEAPSVDAVPIVAKPLPWPQGAVEQVRAVADVLTASVVTLSIDDIAARFSARGAWKKRLPQLLDMLVALGRARELDGCYARA